MQDFQNIVPYAKCDALEPVIDILQTERSSAVESATFRKWLVEHGCRIDHGEHQQRHKSHVIVTVHREGRKAEVPLGGSRRDIDPRVVRQACVELGLDPAQLPGPKSRV